MAARRAQRSHGKIGDCEQSSKQGHAFPKFASPCIRRLAMDSFECMDIFVNTIFALVFKSHFVITGV